MQLIMRYQIYQTASINKTGFSGTPGSVMVSKLD